MELSEIISIISLIIQVITKLAFFAICLYYGNIALKGWKGKKNAIFSIIAIIILGFISFFGGIILKDLIGLDFIFLEYLTSLAIAFICFFLMSFISTAFEVKDNYATKMDLSAIINDLTKLKIQVAKISKALEDEKISPKELTEEDIKEKIKIGLDEKGLKKYSILSLEKHADYWTAKISGPKEVIIDAYTGQINEISNLTNPLSLLYKKPLFSIGIILSLILIGLLLTNLNQSAINAFNDAFDFSFLTVPILPVNCVKASILLESLNKSDIKPSAGVNISALNKTIFDRTGTYLIFNKIRKASYNNSNFIISVSYESAVSDIVSELTANPMENIYKIRVCALRDDYEICECIGDKQTDPAFTVPYLINLDLINDAILNAIQGLLPAGLAGLLSQ